MQETLLTLGSFILVDILDKVQYNKHLTTQRSFYMNKLTPDSIAKINFLMLKTTQEYIDSFVTDVNDSNYIMYTMDVQHNINALAQFNKDNNVQDLHENIMRQDTLVREYYIETLRYIENNKLISANRYCCV